MPSYRHSKPCAPSPHNTTLGIVAVSAYIQAEDHLRFPFVRDRLAVGDRVQVPDPGFLHRVLRVFGGADSAGQRNTGWFEWFAG